MSVQDLEVAGLSHIDALKVHASIILAKKMSRLLLEKEQRYIIRSPEDGARYLYPKISHLKQEHLVVLFMNTKNEVMKYETVFIGSLNASIVHPREIFNKALKYSSASVVGALMGTER